MFDKEMIVSVGKRLLEANRPALVSHIRPDGDAIGSLLGLGLSLLEKGKDVQIISVDGVPSNFHHLAGYDLIRNRLEGEFDYLCVLDCSDFSRFGGALDSHKKPDLNIDHHQTNINFAKTNLVNTKAVATTEILAELLPQWDLPITPAVATALLSGLITDTIGFRTANMTPIALRLAADLMELGANLPDLYYQSLVVRTFEALRLWGEGLSNLERNDKLIWTSLTLADREAVMYPGLDDADLINLLSTVEGTEIAVIFMEQRNGRIKVSWRARPGIDISQVAVGFGGGGHPAASGAEIRGTILDVQVDVLSKTRPLIGM